MERSLVQFQDRLMALERECQLFRNFGGWKDDSHSARARQLLRELSALERALSADRSLRMQLAFQRQNLLLRYQTFKRAYRQFWEHLSG
jgi:hypothetical protein